MGERERVEGCHSKMPIYFIKDASPSITIRCSIADSIFEIYSSRKQAFLLKFVHGFRSIEL